MDTPIFDQIVSEQIALAEELDAFKAVEADEAYAEMQRDLEDARTSYAEWYQDAALAHWDDDPNPYHGDYAEDDGY